MCGTYLNYRIFIKELTDIARPQQINKGTEKFSWTPQCDEAFKNLQIVTVITLAPILRYLIMNLPFVLDNDANAFALEGVLQIKDGRETNRVLMQVI